MAASARKSNPKLWERVQARAIAAEGGRPGQWARKAGGSHAGLKRAGRHFTRIAARQTGARQTTNREGDTEQ